MRNIVILLLFFACVAETDGQQLTRKQRTQLLAGLSTNEVAHLGVRYRIHQSVLGLNLGIVPPLSNGQYFASVGTYYSLHLWGSSKKTDLKPWYLKAELAATSYSLWYTRVTNARGKMLFALIHLGRDFNITKRLGTTFSIGPAAQIYAKAHNDNLVKEGFYFSNYLSFDLGVFYRLQKI